MKKEAGKEIEWLITEIIRMQKQGLSEKEIGDVAHPIIERLLNVYKESPHEVIESAFIHAQSKEAKGILRLLAKNHIKLMNEEHPKEFEYFDPDYVESEYSVPESKEQLAELVDILAEAEAFAHNFPLKHREPSSKEIKKFLIEKVFKGKRMGKDLRKEIKTASFLAHIDSKESIEETRKRMENEKRRIFAANRKKRENKRNLPRK